MYYAYKYLIIIINKVLKEGIRELQWIESISRSPSSISSPMGNYFKLY